jgi:putative FmdB family regulatory protein
MPTYDYECQACGHAFEKFQSITAPAIRKCPECGKLKVKRLIGTGAGVIFKGSGCYCTDYRSPSYQQAAKADKPATSSDKSGGDNSSKSESASSSDSSSGSGSSSAAAD